MSIFDEQHIVTHEDNPDDNNEEYCPVCGQNGYLLDNPSDVETIRGLQEIIQRLQIVFNESTLGDIKDIQMDILKLINKLSTQ